MDRLTHRLTTISRCSHIAERWRRPEALHHFRATLDTPEELVQVGGAAQVYSNMAAAGLLTGDDQKLAADALSTLRAAVDAAPRDANARIRLAERLIEDAAAARTPGRAVEAEAALRGALELLSSENTAAAATRSPPQQRRRKAEESRLHALNLLGTLLQSQPGRWREAASAYRGALGTGRAGADAYHNLGTVHQRLGQYDEARDLYDVALRLAPATPNVYVSLASLASPPENVRLLRSAIALRPTDAQSYVRLAAALAPAPLGGATPPTEAELRKGIGALSHAARLAPSGGGDARGARPDARRPRDAATRGGRRRSRPRGAAAAGIDGGGERRGAAPSDARAG